MMYSSEGKRYVDIQIRLLLMTEGEMRCGVTNVSDLGCDVHFLGRWVASWLLMGVTAAL